jgi:hypothetical protein
MYGALSFKFCAQKFEKLKKNFEVVVKGSENLFPEHFPIYPKFCILLHLPS